jgi:acetyl-CoA synthetase
MVERHKITQFYTAPTAIRALMTNGDSHTQRDLSSLRILGSVGEPINKDAWEWYYNVIGRGKCDIVDTWWQTETGSILMTPIPGVTQIKPGACSHAFFGLQPVLLDPATGQELHDEAKGVLAFRTSWPGIARTIFGDHQRFVETYFKPYPGYYFTGDGAYRDTDGHYWIYGRVDDVISVSGHRIGTAEIEAALQTVFSCKEAAVVAVPHPIKGQAIFCFCVCKYDSDKDYVDDNAIVETLKNAVRVEVGPIATPERIVIVPGLPKTRSGKIMRRILRKIACGESGELGDVSTLLDPHVVQQIIDVVARKK